MHTSCVYSVSFRFTLIVYTFTKICLIHFFKFNVRVYYTSYFNK